MPWSPAEAWRSSGPRWRCSRRLSSRYAPDWSPPTPPCVKVCRASAWSPRRAAAATDPTRSLVLSLASALSESPGESWTRLVLAGLGVEAEQQAEIRGPDGRFVARVDFLVRGERLVIEFDGAMKYDGLEGRRALVSEKRREDELRSLGYRVVRLTWADLADPGRVLALLRRGVHQRTSRPSAYGSAS